MIHSTEYFALNRRHFVPGKTHSTTYVFSRWIHKLLVPLLQKKVNIIFLCLQQVFQFPETNPSFRFQVEFRQLLLCSFKQLDVCVHRLIPAVWGYPDLLMWPLMKRQCSPRQTRSKEFSVSWGHERTCEDRPPAYRIHACRVDVCWHYTLNGMCMVQHRIT